MTPMIPSMPGGKQAFRKPWLDYGDQIKVLESRGLQVQNPQEAQAWLAHVNYYPRFRNRAMSVRSRGKLGWGYSCLFHQIWRQISLVDRCLRLPAQRQ